MKTPIHCLVCAASVAACGAPADEGDVSSSLASVEMSGSKIAFAPRAHPFGRSMTDWSERWWQWIYGIASDKNPMLDATGERCAEGQRGTVWNLASALDPGGAATVTRSCRIPE